MNLNEIQPLLPNVPLKPTGNDWALACAQLVTSIISCICFAYYAFVKTTKWECHAGHRTFDENLPDPFYGGHAVSLLFQRLL